MLRKETRSSLSHVYGRNDEGHLATCSGQSAARSTTKGICGFPRFQTCNLWTTSIASMRAILATDAISSGCPSIGGLDALGRELAIGRKQSNVTVTAVASLNLNLNSAVNEHPITDPPGPNSRWFAVLGAGFGGVSVAWHLLQNTSGLAPVCVDLFDEVGIGGGASGASGGLLHPYNPKGKLLWKGAEGWTAALRLLAVAEATRCRTSTTSISDLDVGCSSTEPLAWRRGILRLARQEKHAITFQKNVKNQDDGSKINLLSGSEAGSLVPGLVLQADGCALHIPQAINIHPQRYLQGLWLACEEFARQAGMFGSSGTQAVFRREKINSLRDLTGSYEAVVVCLGAQANLLPELGNKLPLSLCRGVVAKLHAPHGSSELYQSGAPNLLSSTWLVAQGERNVLLGATKDWGSTDTSSFVSAEERSIALENLFAETTLFYPSISKWEVIGMQAGLRAVPPRSPLGSLPLVGCIDDLVQGSHFRVTMGTSNRGPQTSNTKWWLLGGLGSRGLIHHGWLGELLARAVMSKNEFLLPQELKQW